MTVTRMHDRELVKCDGCGQLTRRWSHVKISSDGLVVLASDLCRACESDTLGAVKLVWEALATR